MLAEAAAVVKGRLGERKAVGGREKDLQIRGTGRESLTKSMLVVKHQPNGKSQNHAELVRLNDLWTYSWHRGWVTPNPHP